MFFSLASELPEGAEVRLLLQQPDGDLPVIAGSPDLPCVAEAMRCLPAGRHVLGLLSSRAAKPQRLIVRAIPEIQYCGFPGASPYPAFGRYDWDFVSRHILPNVNTIIGSPSGPEGAAFHEWRQRGGKWIIHTGVPAMHGPPITPQQAEQYWLDASRLEGHVADAIIADELFSDYNPNYPSWTEAVRRLHLNPDFQGVQFYPYCNTLAYGEQSTDLVRGVLDQGGYAAWIRYIAEEPTEAMARAQLRRWLTNELAD